MTIRCNKNTRRKLEFLVMQHENGEYRRNTIISAAIAAFVELPLEEQKKYLSKIRLDDGRLEYNKAHADLRGVL